MRRALLPLLALVGGLLALGPAAPAQTTFMVTRFDDPAPNGCAPADCSLREAVVAANDTAGADTVQLAEGVYSITLGPANDDLVVSGDLDVYEDLTVQGVSMTGTIIDVVVADRAFDAQAAALTLRDLRVANGGQVPQGGAIRGRIEPLTLERVAVTGSIAESGGGVLTSLGTDLTITDSVISENSSIDIGGGVAAINDGGAFGPGSVTITRSRIVDNETGASGGGLFVEELATAGVIASEVAGNAADLGGGIAIEGPQTIATIADSMVLDNMAGGNLGQGGGIYGFSATVVVENTVVEGNSAHNGFGGGIRLEDTQGSLLGVHISSNDAQIGGGGLSTAGTEETRVDRSLVEGNLAETGGGIHAAAPLVMETTTVSRNLANMIGGVWVSATHLEALSVTIAGNSAAQGNVGNLYVDLTAALTGVLLAAPGGGTQADDQNCDFPGTVLATGSVSSDASCAFGAGNLNSADAMIGPLAANGGDLASHALLPGSDAIDAGGLTCPPLDVRDVERPVDGNQDGTEACDAGVYEFTPGADLVTSLADSPDPVAPEATLTYTATVFNGGPDTAAGARLALTLADGLEDPVPMTTAGTCATAGQVITCDLGTLMRGTAAEVRVSATTPAEEGDLTTTAAATSGAADPTPDDALAEATTTVSSDAPPPPPDGGEPEGVERLAGPSRVETAIAISQDAFSGGAAGVAVLARADLFPDALAGTPLAIANASPLLLTQPDALHPAVAKELQRVLADGAVVVLLGGPGALSEAVAAEVEGLGFTTVRLSGDDRFATAVAIADQGLENPDTLFLADGGNFPDALAAGPGAAALGGAVLLTAGTQVPPALASYLGGEGVFTTRYAVGGAAAQAVPEAMALVGPSRVETALTVADALFPEPTTAGIATAANFPDALAGGAHVGALGGPILLTPGDSLHPAVGAWLQAHADTLTTVYLYGGEPVLSPAVAAAVAAALA